MIYKFFGKNSAWLTDQSVSGSGIVNNKKKKKKKKIKQNRRPLELAALQLAEELHKPIIRKF